MVYLQVFNNNNNNIKNASTASTFVTWCDEEEKDQSFSHPPPPSIAGVVTTVSNTSATPTATTLPFLPLKDVEGSLRAKIEDKAKARGENNGGEDVTVKPVTLTASLSPSPSASSTSEVSSMMATLTPLIASAKEDGNMYVQMQDFQEALDCYRHALRAMQRVFMLSSLDAPSQQREDPSFSSATTSDDDMFLDGSVTREAFMAFTQQMLAIASNYTFCMLKLNAGDYKHAAKAEQFCVFFRTQLKALKKKSQKGGDENTTMKPWLTLYGKLLFRTAALHMERRELKEAKMLYEEILAEVDSGHVEAASALKKLAS